jgi:Ni/Fe-hydrogenase subunit HybB-like protein
MVSLLSDGTVLPNTGSAMRVYHLVLAGLSTPLVLSVHTIVSFDFATSVIPGWHTTIFPPYFVAGAIFSGFAMVQTLMVIIRKVFQMEDYITMGHIEAMNKVIVLTGSIVGYRLYHRIVHGLVQPE